MPKSTSGTFDRQSHTYTLGGEILPSVTSIITEVLQIDHSFSTPGSAGKGTRVHDYLADRDTLGLYDMVPDEEIAPYVRAWDQFCADYAWRDSHIEYSMYGGGYAGTVDRIGSWQGSSQPVLLDYKTGKNKHHYGYQLAAYTGLAFRAGIYVEDRVILELRQDGDYSVRIKYKDQKYGSDSWDEGWSNILGVYNIIHRNG